MAKLWLLELDGIANVLLGLPLVLFPQAVSRFLGLPAAGETLYPAILGAVFVGIGVALLLQRFKPSMGGLGLGGAMSINLLFGVVLAGWLLLSGANLSGRGVVVLSILAVILIGFSTAEALSLRRANSQTQPDDNRSGDDQPGSSATSRRSVCAGRPARTP